MAAPARKDAIRNRARLIEAAAKAFREQGLDVSVNAIARAAGVNIATLYRHFPAKEDLVAAVIEQVLAPLAAARDAALGADRVLETFLHESARGQAEQRGFADALLREGVREQLREGAYAIVAPVVERAHREGELRADFGARDLLLVLRMVSVLAASPRTTPAELERHLGVLLRGLAPSA